MRSYAKRQSLAIANGRERARVTYVSALEKPRGIVRLVRDLDTPALISLGPRFPWLRTSPHDHSHVTTNPGPAPLPTGTRPGYSAPCPRASSPSKTSRCPQMVHKWSPYPRSLDRQRGHYMG
jgi:hypothetical protein